jgi:hypothetical protein
MNVGDLLERYTPTALETIAKLNDLSLNGEICHKALIKALLQPDRIREAVDRLDHLERLALEHLQLQDGSARTALVKQELIQCGFISDSPSDHYLGSPYRQMPRYFEDVIARLTGLGLVFSLSENGNSHKQLSPGRRLVIPQAICDHLPPVAEWMPHLEVSQLSDTAPGSAEAFQRDLFLFWSYINSNNVTLTTREYIPKRHWTRIHNTFRKQEDVQQARNEGETDRLYFLHLLMSEIGLFCREGSELRPASGSRDFLGLSLRARTERSFRGWLRTAKWNELYRIRELRIDPSQRDSRISSALKGGRQFVTGLLRHTPPEKWISIQDLIERAKAVNYEFLLPGQNNYHSFHSPYYGHNNVLSWEFPLGDKGQSWELVEARFIANVLQEPLHWMGIVSLGWKGRKLEAFQITPLGAQILGIRAPEPEQTPSQRLIVQPNFQIFALDPISDYTLSTLDEFAERTKNGHVFEYHLTRESVYEAQQKGMTVSEIINFLDKESSTPVPQNVKLTLQEWGRYHERIVFYQDVSLCQAANSEIMQRLQADPALQTLLRHPVSSTAALVDNQDKELESLRKALQDKGLLPTTSAPQEETSPPPAFVTAKGEIEFRHDVPDIHLLSALRPFTEVKDGKWQITSQAVENAVREGWSATRILRFLSKMQGETLQPEMVSKIKVWGKHYGRAALQTVTLLQLKGSHILEELAEDPDIGPLIEPFSISEALAIVRQEDVPALKKMLRKKGIEWQHPLMPRHR